MAKIYWCLIAWHIDTYVQVKHVTLCTLMQGEITITQEGQKFANVGRLLSISLGGLLYIVAIHLVLIYEPWYLHVWKSLIFDKEQWSLWLPNHVIMPKQWFKCVALFDIGNGEVLVKLADVCSWRAPKSRGETKLKVPQSQVAESRFGSTLPASNSRKG